MTQLEFAWPDAKPVDPESDLRESWTEKGISVDRQDEIVADIEAKAAPGACVGPFRSGYPLNHPWHYLARGDGAKPPAVDDIPPGKCEASWFDLPYQPKKRRQKRASLLEQARIDLTERKARYLEVVERGAAALSVPDRTIAYGGNDELARASTLALLVNQISYLSGKIQWLEAHR